MRMLILEGKIGAVAWSATMVESLGIATPTAMSTVVIMSAALLAKVITILIRLADPTLHSAMLSARCAAPHPKAVL